MKTKPVERDVRSFGVVEKSRATILASPKAFAILADGLYADKPRAVIRELGTNAYDAHVEAGNKDEPFEVKLPTLMDPTYTIRDFGTGLSHDDVMHLYQTFFGSSRGDSNEVIGTLGLGSKSPYSYSSAFTVISYFNGAKRTYTCGLDEEGIPSCSFMKEEATEEPNGLQISIPVKSGDFNEFNRKAGLIFRRFNPQPIIKGDNGNYDISMPAVALSGNGWRIRENTNRWGERKQIAIMGFIEYPINWSAIADEARAALNVKVKNLLKAMDIEVDFAIGDLDIAASREELGYTVDTSKALVARFDQVAKEILAQFQEKINEAKTYRQACQIYTELEVVRNGIDSQDLNFTYKGKPVDSSIYINLDDVGTGLMYRCAPDVYLPKVIFERLSVHLVTYENHHHDRSKLKGVRGNAITWDWLDGFQKKLTTYGIRTTPDSAVVLDNGEDVRAPSRRIRYFFQQHPNVKKVWVFKFENARMQKNFLDYIDFGDVPVLQELPDAPKEERAKHQSEPIVNRFTRTDYYLRKDSEFWNRVRDVKNAFEADEIYPYVQTHRNAIIKSKFDNHSLAQTLRRLRGLGIDLNVYGVGTSFIPRLKNLKGTWVEADRVIKEKLEGFTKTADFVERTFNTELNSRVRDYLSQHGSLSSSVVSNRLQDVISALGSKADPRLVKLNEKLQRIFGPTAKLVGEDSQNLQNLLSTLQIEVRPDVTSALKEIEVLLDELKAKYKVIWELSFFHTDFHRSTSDFKKRLSGVVEFFELVDKAEAQKHIDKRCK